MHSGNIRKQHAHSNPYNTDNMIARFLMSWGLVSILTYIVALAYLYTKGKDTQ